MPAEWNLPSLIQQEPRRVFDNDEDLDAPFMTVDPWRGRWGRRLYDATVDVETGPSASQILAQAPFGRYKPDAVPRVPQVVPEDVPPSPSSLGLDIEMHSRRRRCRSRKRSESIAPPTAGPYHDAAGYGLPLPPSARVPYGLDNGPPSAQLSTPSPGPRGRASLDGTDSGHAPRFFTSLDFYGVGFHSRPDSVVEPEGARTEIPAPIPKTNSIPRVPIRVTPPPGHSPVDAHIQAEAHSPGLERHPSTFAALATFIWQVVPTTLYLCALFRLPALYFSRVARVFENADLCRRDIIRMAVARATLWEQALGGSVNHSQAYGYTFHEPQGRELSFPLLQFKKTWEQFVDNLLHEWKVLNVISALLTSAVLTILQIDAAAADPVVRTAALLALVCTLMSLLYGCLYTVRFGSMKAMYKASEWALSAAKQFVGSIVSFIIAIMAFVWRTGAGDKLKHADPFTTPGQALASRVIISFSLALGAAYFVLVVHRRWRENVYEQMRR
ncbi:hypothetical protein EV121DRAFT_271811 [Schizophyllum commune]